MSAEIWSDGEKIGDAEWNSLPEVGDIIEVYADEATSPYEVVKVYNFFARGAFDPVLRIDVKYAGPIHFGVL